MVDPPAIVWDLALAAMAILVIAIAVRLWRRELTPEAMHGVATNIGVVVAVLIWTISLALIDVRVAAVLGGPLGWGSVQAAKRRRQRYAESE